MKMYEVLDLPAFYAKLKQINLPIKTAYKLNKIFAACDAEVQFYQTQFKDIIESYAEKDIDGNFIYIDDEQKAVKVKEGKESECQQKMNELLNLDVDIKCDSLLTLDELGFLNLSIEEYKPLFPFIKE